MDCIPYINDLQVEIKILNDIKAMDNCNVDEIDKKIYEKQRLINECKENLTKLSDNQIFYKLYCYILSGNTATKAIEKLSEENYRKDIKPSSLTALWNYYKKMQKTIGKDTKV